MAFCGMRIGVVSSELELELLGFELELLPSDRIMSLPLAIGVNSVRFSIKSKLDKKFAQPFTNIIPAV
ncbi:hypothetical protein R83H12_02533 [Fibrobacteria bacterium R8-3-H12]